MTEPVQPQAAGRSVIVRNTLVYGSYAILVLIIQLALLLLLDEERTLPLLAPACLVLLPAAAWAAGWFTLGVVFPAGPGEPAVDRTPRLGATICLAPDLALCAGVGVLFLAG